MARSRRLAAALLLLAVPGGLGVHALVTTPAPGDHHPLVASSLRQPAASSETPSPDRSSDSPDPEDVPGVGPLGPGTGGFREDLPGHLQGGASLPRPAGPSTVVPILLYHYIRGVPRQGWDRQGGFRLSVAPDVFARQMALLDADGAHTVSLGDVIAALDGGPALPPHPVVLTFDDGHDDFAFRAVPVLKEYGMTATAFVVPGFLGRSSYMSISQLRGVVAAGMTIGAHTMNHVNLVRVSRSVARDQIERSRTVLQELTGQPVLDFAYPFGVFTSAVIGMVKADGFRDAVSTEPGSRQYESQRYTLHRVEVTGYDSLAVFARKAGLRPPARNWVAPPPPSSSSSAEASPPAAEGPASPSPQPVPDTAGCLPTGPAPGSGDGGEPARPRTPCPPSPPGPSPPADR